MIVKERRTVHVDDLVIDLMDSMVGIEDYQIVSAYDTKGNRVSTDLEIVIEYEVEDNVDKDEETPEETNNWLREAGF